ncbi:ligand-binding sensor domain-containing protein [Mucilaginibacter terrae]|uniref:Ligand-binding sensor domain-containing protein n=1 Tax=Mucilaginibacter terrae TaxID=1955052 RepID=A0ABU3GQ96_9SPHI|nr:triple tyrosine motif-containing protein [Mucilaginibacter terrae]MDT3401959.1 ligand-binding sensor domain-containing protein [Mucilaginibacter terrae]
MKKALLTILTCFLFFFFLYAQNPVGLPQIVNYTNLDYKGGIQNWAIDQDKGGRVYFANNEGLLSFDGKHWKLYRLPNYTVVHALKIDDNGRIYVGAQDEIGYYQPNPEGILSFHSLKSLIPKASRQFADIWNICHVNGDTFFRTVEKIFYLKDGTISVYKTGTEWTYLGTAQNRVYAQQKHKGLMVFDNGTWKTACDNQVLKEGNVTAVLDYAPGMLLVATLKNGLFLLKGNTLTPKTTAADDIFKTSYAYCAIAVNKDWFAIGTTASACYVIDRGGNVIQHFSSDEGLQKNYIRNLFTDKAKNLWLALDDGIDFIAFNSAIKQIFPDNKKQISSYTSRIFNNQLYVGASNGLFKLPLDMQAPDLSYSRGHFKEVGKLRGQVWGLNEINHKLLLAHEDGAFEVQPEKLQPVSQNTGNWLFEPLSAIEPSPAAVAGTYDGLQLLNYQNGSFRNGGIINGVDKTSLRFLAYDNNNNVVWASHPYRGVFKLTLSPNHQRIIQREILGIKDGLPAALGNYVFRIKNRIVVATLKGIYEYNDNTKRFQRSALFEPYTHNTGIHYLNEDAAGNVWFVNDKKLGVVDFSTHKDRPTVIYFPELTSKLVSGFEHIYPYDQQNIFVGANKGIYHINFLKYREQSRQPINVLLTQVKVLDDKDSVVFGGYAGKPSPKPNEQIKLPHELNSLHFEFASTLYEQQNTLEFSYQLVGFDKQWSAWSTKAEKEYTNLPAGTYTFKVKVRNNMGSESVPAGQQIVIEAAWYQSWWFYVLCLVVAAGSVHLFIKRQQRKHLKEQEKLKYLHQLELEHNEREIMKLQNEKLVADVVYKNKELASTTMHLVQRGKLLAKIKDELLPLVANGKGDKSTDFKRVIRLLNEAERNDGDWEQFAIHFDHIHSNFLSRLKERFPELSPNDLKLCAYLKMNLTSKEIAQLMSITIKAVEVSRYRLRKKMQIPSDMPLFDYLIKAISQSSQFND